MKAVLIALALLLSPPIVLAADATPAGNGEYIVKSSESLWRTADLVGMNMQYATQEVFNQAARACPTGFDIKQQSVRREDGYSFLVWRVACVTPATPSPTDPSAPR